MPCDLLIAVGELLVRDFVQHDGWRQAHRCLARQGLERLGEVVRIVVGSGGCAARQARRVALAHDDSFDDGHAGHARAITHDLG